MDHYCWESFQDSYGIPQGAPISSGSSASGFVAPSNTSPINQPLNLNPRTVGSGAQDSYGVASADPIGSVSAPAQDVYSNPISASGIFAEVADNSQRFERAGRQVSNLNQSEEGAESNSEEVEVLLVNANSIQSKSDEVINEDGGSSPDLVVELTQEFRDLLEGNDVEQRQEDTSISSTTVSTTTTTTTTTPGPTQSPEEERLNRINTVFADYDGAVAGDYYDYNPEDYSTTTTTTARPKPTSPSLLSLIEQELRQEQGWNSDYTGDAEYPAYYLDEEESSTYGERVRS